MFAGRLRPGSRSRADIPGGRNRARSRPYKPEVEADVLAHKAAAYGRRVRLQRLRVEQPVRAVYAGEDAERDGLSTRRLVQVGYTLDL
jgi:hypothetical protein